MESVQFLQGIVGLLGDVLIQKATNVATGSQDPLSKREEGGTPRPSEDSAHVGAIGLALEPLAW